MGTPLRLPERCTPCVRPSSVEFSTWFRCSTTTGERRSPSSSKPSHNDTMISPNDARKVGGNCRPKFALALVVALVCAVAEASRYKSYEPEPSYGSHYEEEDYGSDYHRPTEYEASHGGDEGYGYGSSYEHKSYDHEPDYGSYEEDHDSYEEPSYGHGGYAEEHSYKTVGGGYKGSHYEQEYPMTKSYKQQPSYGGQHYKQSYRHKRAIPIPFVMPRRKVEEGIKMIKDMSTTLRELKTKTNTKAIELLNEQIQGASKLFQRMLQSMEKKIE